MDTDLLLLARGGENVTGDTLSRFYALHVAILPLLTLAVCWDCTYVPRATAWNERSGAREAQRYGGPDRVPTMSISFPTFCCETQSDGISLLAILAALAALFPWELGEKAEPFSSAPEGIKPEWYFLFMFQALKQLPPHIMGVEGEMTGSPVFWRCRAGDLPGPFLGPGKIQPTGAEYLSYVLPCCFLHCHDRMGLFRRG